MSSNSTSLKELFLNGIIKENTIFKLALSLCPSIAVTNNLKNGIFMGLAVLFVQTMVNITISPDEKGHSAQSKAADLHACHFRVGHDNANDDGRFCPGRLCKGEAYIALIVAFASILARAEMFASKNSIMPSMADGLGMGVGFLFALTAISFFRELVGKGTLTLPTGLATQHVFTFVNTKPLLIMVLPAGGFLAVGILMAAFNWIDAKYMKKGAHGTH